jgi:polysaccharide export outer membrane protein
MSAKDVGKKNKRRIGAMRMREVAWLNVTLFVLAVVAFGQDTLAPRAGQALANCDSQIRSTYQLGPDDEIDISEPEFDQPTNKTARIDGNGNIQVPLVGRVPVAGLTVEQAEQELSKRLSTYIRHPEVAVSIKELHSEPVSILGAVNTPGVHQVEGHKTLLEMLSLAGGLRTDAGYSVRITRQIEWGCIPLANARLDPLGQFSVGEVNLKQIIDAENPEGNIQILPHDVISVPKAEMIYVIGDVKRTGGFVLGQDQSMSVLQALSLAEGLNGTANTRHAKILRQDAQTHERVETPVDVQKILNGKSGDVPLLGDDILFIPSSIGKKTTLRAIEAAVQAGTGLMIWRVP